MLQSWISQLTAPATAKVPPTLLLRMPQLAKGILCHHLQTLPKQSKDGAVEQQESIGAVKACGYLEVASPTMELASYCIKRKLNK